MIITSKSDILLKIMDKNSVMIGGIKMATVKPFQCVRPTADLAERVAGLPYDV